MPVELSKLEEGFREKLDSLLTACKVRGVEMRPYFAIRTPFEQAKLWRQSRTREEINQKIAWLFSHGAPFLAHCLESVGPQNGRHVTNAIPGLSWHQWGEAVDCFWAVGEKAEWSAAKKVGDINGYHVYAAEAAELGLDPGGLWKKIKDWPHVQLRSVGSPAKLYSFTEIDEKMQQVFGG